MSGIQRLSSTAELTGKAQTGASFLVQFELIAALTPSVLTPSSLTVSTETKTEQTNHFLDILKVYCMKKGWYAARTQGIECARVLRIRKSRCDAQAYEQAEGIGGLSSTHFNHGTATEEQPLPY